MKIGDENDNAPVFLYKEYKAVINGNQPLNVSFMKVSHYFTSVLVETINNV